jgi:hypothetical protein
MFCCDSNFTETKDLTLAIVAERVTITFTLRSIRLIHRDPKATNSRHARLQVKQRTPAY